MASDTTPPGGATRYIQTTRGLLSYSQLAPLLAKRVLAVENAIAARSFGAHALSKDINLRAGDGLDWKPLTTIWRKRFEQFKEAAE